MNTTEGMQARVAAVARKPFVRRGAIAILVLIVLFGLIGYFVLPGLIKSKVESLVEEKLGRKLGIEAIPVELGKLLAGQYSSPQECMDAIKGKADELAAPFRKS